MVFNISELQRLIARNETGEAIDILVSGIKKIKSKQLRADLIQISGRWNSYKSTKRTGTQDHATLGVEQRQINDALVDLLSAIEEETSGGIIPGEINWARFFAIVGAIIAALAGIAEITGKNISNMWADKPEKVEEPTTQTEEQEDSKKLPKATPPKKEPTRRSSKENQSTSTNKQLSEEDLPKSTNELPSEKPNQLFISTKTNKGANSVNFKSNETMRLYYKVNKPCLMRVIYKLADDRLILFENDLQINQEQVGEFIEIGDGYEASKPFGNESIYFFVQTDSFPKLKTELSEDGYQEIKEGLGESLRKTRGMKKKKYQAESKIDLITQE